MNRLVVNPQKMDIIQTRKATQQTRQNRNTRGLKFWYQINGQERLQSSDTMFKI